MAMVSWAGAGMEVVDGMHAGQSQVGVACQEMLSISRVGGDTLMAPDPTAI